MKRNIPDLEKATEEQKKIYSTLDENLEVDIHIFENNDVAIVTRLGDTILSTTPLHCNIKGDELSVDKYEIKYQ